MNLISKALTIIAICLIYSFNCYANEKSKAFDKIVNNNQQFNRLWQALETKNKEFLLWKPNWKQNEKRLKARFNQMQKERLAIYFATPEELGKEGISGKWKNIRHPLLELKSLKKRYPYPDNLLYSRVTPNYNASFVKIGGHNFIAMEAPSSKNLQTFLKILIDNKVTDLVRLAPAQPGKKRGFPYWDGRLDINSLDGELAIKISNREINYFVTDLWANNLGIKPEKLLALIKAVKRSIISGPKVIAVHCSAGTGRTGTFIVGYVLIDKIDEQLARGVSITDIKISIEEVFWKLVLQRPYALAHFSQYVTLYELISYYLNECCKVGRT